MRFVYYHSEISSNQSVELNECHRTLFRQVISLRIAKQYLGEPVSFSGTRHSTLRYTFKSILLDNTVIPYVVL